MLKSADTGFILSTDLVDYIVKKNNLPFRTAYNITAKIVNSNVTGEKIAEDTIPAGKLKNDSIVTSNITNRNVTGEKIAQNAITHFEIDISSIKIENMASNSIGNNQVVNKSIIANRILKIALSIFSNPITANIAPGIAAIPKRIALLISTIFNLKYDIAPEMDATETHTKLVPTAVLLSQPNNRINTGHSNYRPYL